MLMKNSCSTGVISSSMIPDHKSLVNLLLIEDNPEISGWCPKMLKGCGGILLSISTLAGCSLMKLLANTPGEKNHRHCTMDLDLPDSRGTGRLEKITGAKDVPPVVVLTGFLDNEIVGIQACAEKRASDYLVKRDQIDCN